MSRTQTTLVSALLAVAMVAVLVAGCGPTVAPTPLPPADTPTTEPIAHPTAPQPTAVPPTALPAAPTLTPVPAGPLTGGSISLAFTEEPNSLDAILGYNLPAWQSLMNLYRGLMIYDGDQAVPEMADGWPEISADGTVYTFTVKSGILFHNGREVEAADFKYSLERVLDPDWASWANYYLVSIKGAQDVIDGKTKDVSGIEVLDKYKLRFTLTAPDMTFLNVLALPNNWVVPKEEVEKWGTEFEKHPVGTGPFMLKELVLGEKAVFVRNPNYYHQGEPYIDETVMYFGIEPSTALMRLEKGELDVLFGDMVPAADFPRLINDVQYADWLFQEPSMYTWWMGVDNTKEALSNPLVRQALNLAVDREKLAKLSAGKGRALFTLYPSTCPGYDGSYKPYSYDPEAAKAKLAEAGYAEGLELELLVGEDPFEAVMAQAIQQDLAAVGIKLNLTQTSDTAIYDKMIAGETQLHLTTWYMVQPDPADLINNIYMTGAGSNYDFYSNAQVDALAMQALAEQDRAKRVQLYKDIEHLIMEDAAHVPLINGMSFYVHRPNIKGFYSRSEYGPYFEKMWVQP